MDTYIWFLTWLIVTIIVGLNMDRIKLVKKYYRFVDIKSALKREISTVENIIQQYRNRIKIVNSDKQLLTTKQQFALIQLRYNLKYNEENLKMLKGKYVKQIELDKIYVVDKKGNIIYNKN